MPTVRLPAPLRPLADGAPTVEADGVTVAHVLRSLEAAHPALGARLLDDSGHLRRHVNVFVGVDDVRDLEGLDTPVAADTLVSIVPAIAGGAV